MELNSGPFSSSAWKDQIHVVADVLEMSQNRLICTECILVGTILWLLIIPMVFSW